MLREKTKNCPSNQLHEEKSENPDHSALHSIEAPDSSKAFLLRQLR